MSTRPTADPAQAPLVTASTAGAAVAAGALLVDVRSAAGRASAGDLPDAVVVAKDEVDRRFTPGTEDTLPQVTSPDRPIVVVCGSPAGSGPFADRLLELGFTDVVHVDGGFPAWKAAGLRVTDPVPTDEPSDR